MLPFLNRTSFHKIKIFSFGILIFINLVAGIFFYIQLGEMIDEISSPIENERPILSHILKIQTLTSNLDISLHEQIAGNVIDNAPTLAFIATVTDELDFLGSRDNLNENVRLFVKDYRLAIKKLKVSLVYYKKNQLADPSSSSSDELYEIIDDLVMQINNQLSGTTASLRKQINESDERLLEDIKFARIALLITFSVVVIGSMLVLSLLNMSLSRNLNLLIQAAAMLGKGDLGWRINSKFRDKFGTLSNAFDEMAEEIALSNQKISQQTNKIEKLAYYDMLTELPNRVSFLSRLKEEISRASRRNEKFAVLFIDLDDFKLVNDKYGHDIGDMLLQQVAKRLKQQTRFSDMVARLGGDEFTILLPEQRGENDVSFVSQRIVNELNRPFDISSRIVDDLSKPFVINEHEVTVSSSIGISLFPDNGKSEAEILRNADTAMYVAKSEGKNTFKFCSQEMADRMQLLFQRERDLKRAVANEDLVLMYQPQVDLETQRLSGFEALIRWIHPERGVISPAEFIPLAEERGIINEITRWVLRTVCRQIRSWQDAGFTLVPIMVNLSAIDFYQKDLENFIHNVLRDENVDPSLLGVEVTETAVMKDKTNAARTLSKIRELGVKISLDDFGTGYSSLNYLQSLPIDIVKIDRSFIQNITIDSKSEDITRAIITMSHALGLKVLVEGVETIEQFDSIRALRSDSCQGYLFSKPVAEEEALKILQSGQWELSR